MKQLGDREQKLHFSTFSYNYIIRLIYHDRAYIVTLVDENEPLTLQDLSNALKEMTPDKSPGPDGLATNFYKCFKNDLKQPLMDSYLFAFEHGELADGQRRALLSLIPKKDKDLRYLKSWRPVSQITNY